MRRTHHRRRTLVCGSLTAVIVALAGSDVQGQGITVTFPARVAAAPDYATDVLGDPWDMCNAADISPFPLELVGFSSFTYPSSPNCTAGGTTSNNDPNVVLLHRGLYGIINPGRNGRNFPIDTTKYQILSYKLTSNAGDGPQIYWFHNPFSHPAGDGLGVRYGSPVNGTQIGVADLRGTPNQGSSWDSGSVAGLRIDPTSIAPAKNVSLRWVRLTPASGSVQRITWSGGSGTATITVTDSGGISFPVASVPSASFYDWNYGVLPPGNYTLTVAKPGSSGSATFAINHPPTIQVTDPSATSGDDFATRVLGNPWDMSDSGDLKASSSGHITPLSFSGGQATATNNASDPKNNDPNVTLNNSVSIDTTKYRYLTYRFQVDGSFDLGLGSVARILWGQQGSLSSANATTTMDILVWPGMNTYTVDLASLSAAPDGGLVDSAGDQPWTASPKLSLRFDPHEFCIPWQASCARTFHIDDVKLTAKPAATAGSFTIRFAGGDVNGDPTTVSLYYDTDTNPANGKTQIASGIAIGAGLFGWNTRGVPQGEYHIYAEANDGIQTTGRYSAVPIQVAATEGEAGRSDFDGDGKSDIGVYRPSDGNWHLLKSSTNSTTSTVRQWGLNGDKPVPGDYDGDEKTDLAVFRPSNGTWYLLQSSTNSTTSITRQWGLNGDVPVPGDYDGDGKTDMAVYRPSNGNWYLLHSSTNATTSSLRQWGLYGDVPVPGDYDGDGKTDMAVYRPSNGNWYLLYSSTNATTSSLRQWGLYGDVPVPGDYDGDGKTDMAVYRPSSGNWYLLQSSTNATTSILRQWGLNGDVPVPGDYDGDGKTDMGVFRQSEGNWYLLQSSTNSTTAIVRQWGLNGDIPAVQK